MTTKKKTITFEEILERLETITKNLEGNDTPLENAVQLFEEGMQLYKHGTQQLQVAEKKIEKLRSDQKIETFTEEGSENKLE